MKRLTALSLCLGLGAFGGMATLAGPALAGDAALGEAGFAQCKTCHSIIAPDGTEIVRGGQIGPNLYGILGQPVGGDPEFSGYSPALAALGAQGLVWDEAALGAFLSDPSGWLQAQSGDGGARSSMSFALGAGAEDIIAYLAQAR